MPPHKRHFPRDFVVLLTIIFGRSHGLLYEWPRSSSGFIVRNAVGEQLKRKEWRSLWRGTLTLKLLEEWEDIDRLARLPVSIRLPVLSYLFP